jgi:hypothetical protein
VPAAPARPKSAGAVIMDKSIAARRVPLRLGLITIVTLIVVISGLARVDLRMPPVPADIGSD